MIDELLQLVDGALRVNDFVRIDCPVSRDFVGLKREHYRFDDVNRGYVLDHEYVQHLTDQFEFAGFNVFAQFVNMFFQIVRNLARV